VIPNSLSDIAYQNWCYFKQLEGSKHIATFSSQLNLLEIIQDYEIKKALDWGAGIGTISNLLKKSKDCYVTAYELNKWCRDQFKGNLALIKEIGLTDEFPSISDFDLIVIDDDINRKQIRLLLKSKNIKIIFIEGWRNKTVGHVSLGLLLRGKSAQFKRCASRLQEFDLYGKNGNRIEKSGSYFIISTEKYPVVLTLNSWVKRIKNTNEFKELFKEIYFWISRSLAVRSRIRTFFKKTD
jgi:hypothetical protein